MAEKDSTEGRCPACRTPYDKEKIVATAAECERMVAEINSERKQKSQKAKPKASEGKMYLNDVRVIQRNLVYIIGLPLNLADEELLQRWEYFGQYGKVFKVSISRTATGAIQHSANNSCCVYITYSKEEDAVRCIQSVHGFVLDGRHLRACFGTTKYCHSWLRNLPCTIPDCLYLHDFGSEEDSFTKDDLVSAFQRSKVQQIIGATNNVHRAGDVLPPPGSKAHSNGKVSPLDSTEGRYNVSSYDIGLSNETAEATSCTSPANANAGTQTRPLSASKSIDRDISEELSSRGSQVATKPFCNEAEKVPAAGNLPGLYSGVSAVSNQSHLKTHCSVPIVSKSFAPNHSSFNMSGSQGLVQDMSNQFERLSTSLPKRETIVVENLLKYDDEKMKPFPMTFDQPIIIGSNPGVARMNSDKVNIPMPIGKPALANGLKQSLPEKNGFFGYSGMLSEVGFGKYLEEGGINIGSVDIDNNATSDTGENSIISKILSIDLETWDDSRALPQDLVELLSDNDTHHGCLKVQSGRKIADGKQSRFSFARQEDFLNSRAEEYSRPTVVQENSGLCMDNYDNFPSFSPVESDNNFSMFSMPITASKIPNSTTPPGFSVPCRIPPPGFHTHGRMQRTFDNSGNHLLQTSALRAHSMGSFGDMEFVDPAILEVGQGMQPTGISDMRQFSPVQHSPFDFNAGLKHMMCQPQPVSEYQTFPNHLNNTLSRNENQSIMPMHFDHYQPNSHSPVTQSTAKPYRNTQMSNLGSWDLWNNNVKAVGDLGMSDLASRRGMGHNSFLPSYEELRNPMSNSSNHLYNPGFAI
ncbi:hypothetical protein ACFE04_003382 [Oxalis oulophora]